MSRQTVAEPAADVAQSVSAISTTLEFRSRTWTGSGIEKQVRSSLAALPARPA